MDKTQLLKMAKRVFPKPAKSQDQVEAALREAIDRGQEAASRGTPLPPRRAYVKIAPQTILPPSKFSASPGAAAMNLPQVMSRAAGFVKNPRKFYVTS